MKISEIHSFLLPHVHKFLLNLCHLCEFLNWIKTFDNEHIIPDSFGPSSVLINLPKLTSLVVVWYSFGFDQRIQYNRQHLVKHRWHSCLHHLIRHSKVRVCVALNKSHPQIFVYHKVETEQLKVISNTVHALLARKYCVGYVAFSVREEVLIQTIAFILCGLDVLLQILQANDVPILMFPVCIA